MVEPFTDLAKFLYSVLDGGEGLSYPDFADFILDVAPRFQVAFFVYQPGTFSGVSVPKIDGEEAADKVVRNLTLADLAEVAFKTAVGGEDLAQALAEQMQTKVFGTGVFYQSAQFAYSQDVRPIFHAAKPGYRLVSYPNYHGMVTYQKLYYMRLTDEQGKPLLPENFDLLLSDYWSKPNAFSLGVFVKAFNDADVKFLSQIIAEFNYFHTGDATGYLRQVVKGIIGRVKAIVDGVFPIFNAAEKVLSVFDGTLEAQIEALLQKVPRGEVYIGKPVSYTFATGAGNPLGYETLSVQVQKVLPPPKPTESPLFENDALWSLQNLIK